MGKVTIIVEDKNKSTSELELSIHRFLDKEDYDLGYYISHDADIFVVPSDEE
jgi:hypothetical protein